MSVKTTDKLIARVNEALAKSASKSAASASQTGNPKGDPVNDVKDPTNKGTVAIPTHPDGDNANKTQTPPNGVNENGKKDVLTNQPGQVGSGGTGEVPGGYDAQSGDAKDRAATSPTVDINKIAANVSKIVTDLKNLNLFPKAAAKEAATAHTGNPKGDKVEDVKDPTVADKSAKPKDDQPIEGVPSDQGANKDKAAAEQFPEAGTEEFYHKLATTYRAICEIEGGAQAVEALIEKTAGVDAARKMMDDVTLGYAGLVKMAEALAEQQMVEEQQMAEYQSAFQELTKNASEADKAVMIKFAQEVFPAIERLETDIEKAAAMAGVQDQAALEDAGGFADAPVEGAPEAAIPGGAEGEPLPIEQIAELLAAMVQAGKLDEATAEQLLTQLVETEGGAPEEAALGDEDLAAAGEDPALAAAAEGGAPAPEEAMLPPEKAAAALLESVK